jgi:Leucine-rich repeat (LRR) protein
VLNLSFNKIETIEYLPPNLEELHMASNQIAYINPAISLPSLLHFGLSYNQIGDSELPKIKNSFPNLFSIDLAFNRVCDL